MKPGDVISLPFYDLPAETMPQTFERDGVKFSILDAWKVYATGDNDSVIEKINIMLGKVMK